MEPEDSSAPCFAHTLVGGHVVDPQTRHDVDIFRRSLRTRLHALRKALSPQAREQAARTISDKLDMIIGDVSGKTIAAYWPMHGEPDLRPWMKKASRQGARITLPVVVEKNHPLAFHLWAPDCEMALDKCQIPVPVKSEPAPPDIIIIPLLGVDKQQYRLGNGDGYYDRTLVQFPKATTIGAGLSSCKIDTIYPMPWDIPMQHVLLVDSEN